MDTQEFIPIEIFCTRYNVEISFVDSLNEIGLIEIVEWNEEKCIDVNHLADAEKIIRLHKDLDINAEGIDVVMQLLQQISSMQEEIELLKSRLRLYE